MRTETWYAEGFQITQLQNYSITKSPNHPIAQSPNRQIAQSPNVLDRFAAEEVDQFDDQDDDHHQFQHKGAALVELVDHEAVEIFGGLQLLFDEVFVVRHSDLLRAQLVEPGREHVAEELDGVVGAFGEFVHIEQDGVQLGRGLRRPPAPPPSGAADLAEGGD